MNRVSLVSWYANIKILLHSNDDKWFCNKTSHSGSYSQTGTHKCYCDTDPFPDLCLVSLWKNVNVRLKRAGLDDSFVSAGQKQRQNTDEGREQLLIPARGKLQPCSLLCLGPLIHIHIHVTLWDCVMYVCIYVEQLLWFILKGFTLKGSIRDASTPQRLNRRYKNFFTVYLR